MNKKSKSMITNINKDHRNYTISFDVDLDIHSENHFKNTRLAIKQEF